MREMFFRIKSTPSGQVLQLIEAYRDEQGQPRQKIVVSLGDALIHDVDRPLVAKAVERQLYAQTEVLQVSVNEAVSRWAELIVRRVRAEGKWMPLGQVQSQAKRHTIDGVLIDDVSHDSKCDLGPVLAGVDAWRRLGMDECLARLGFNSSQRLSAAISIVNRLVDPVSDNALADWVKTTALPELIGSQVLESTKDRFYRVSDELHGKRKAIEAHLRKRQQEEFGLERTVLLYDLTNTHFEGEALANPKARRGKNKQKRDDCPQVVVGMVFDEYGFELAHEVFEGNMHDSKTLVKMVDQLSGSSSDGNDDQQLCPPKPVVILDGGVATQANRKWLRKSGYSYLVNETRAGRKKWAEEFAQDDHFETVGGREGKAQRVRVRVVEHSFSDDGYAYVERLVLCKSQGREQKESAIRTRSEERFVKALESLAKRIDSGKLKDAAKIERAIGRLQAQHTRIARFYTVKLHTVGRMRLEWHSRDEERKDADGLLGCYVLRAYDAGESGKEQATARTLPLDGSRLWQLYMTLAKAEEGFRSIKGVLGLRPIRHQKEDRCDGHIFITVLAYQLLRHILHRLELSGDVRNWDTIKRILYSHTYASIEIPTAQQGTHRIRRAGNPDEAVRNIYTKLGIEWTNLPTTREFIPK